MENMQNGIRVDTTCAVARKVVAVLAAEKCTVGEAKDILRCAAGYLNRSPVTVQNEN